MLPTESVNEADEPALIRTGGNGVVVAVVAAGAAATAGAAGAAAGAGAAGAADSAGAAGAAATAGAAGAADVLSPLTLADWQPVNKITAAIEIKDHSIEHFTFCINFLWFHGSHFEFR